jgi:ribonuclease Z
MKLTITAFSTARYATWIFVDELRLLFDAGDGVSAVLGARGGKIRNVLISHADRDHLGGLLQFHQLHAGGGKPRIHYPEDCGSFPALRDFLERFDPDIGPASWQPMVFGAEIEIGRDFVVHTHRSEHIVCPPEASKCLGFRVHHRKKTLRKRFKGMPGAEIAKLRQELGEAAVHETVELPILGYSGDSPELDPSLWRGVPILLHECTFLDDNTSKYRHANLPQVLDAAKGMNLEALVLTHFSTRFTQSEIRNRVRSECAKRRIRFPVHALLPGEIQNDLLAQKPAWTP